jgi:hypothetical protein
MTSDLRIAIYDLRECGQKRCVLGLTENYDMIGNRAKAPVLMRLREFAPGIQAK